MRVARQDSSLLPPVTGIDGREPVWSVPASGGEPVVLVVFDDLSVRDGFACDGERFYFTMELR